MDVEIWEPNYIANVQDTKEVEIEMYNKIETIKIVQYKDYVKLQLNLKQLLNQIAEKNQCKACNKTIWFVKHKNGKLASYTEEGLNHFADCPNAEEFRK